MRLATLLRSSSLLTTLAVAACAGEPAQTAAPACPVQQPSDAAEAPASRDRVAEIDALSQRARELFEVPGLAIAVVHRGELVLARGYGERELGKGVAVDEHTSFAIASNTKAFVATAIGLLVADGKLGWDDRVVDHLPDLKLWDDYVTRELRVRDLLSHRVGLATWEGDLMWISSKFSFAQIYARLRDLHPEAGLRQRYGYCNLMYGVAGELIRKVGGEPWDAFVRARLLAPLGMDAVATNLAQLDGHSNLAAPHIEVDGQWQTTARLDLSNMAPAGALDASVSDMVNWLRMQLDGGRFGDEQIVPEAVIRETRQPHIWLETKATDVYDPPRHLRGYGLGWGLDEYRGRLLVSHGGGLPGMTSRVLLVPDEQLGIVVLTNSESPTSALLALQVADLFLTDAPAKDYLGEAAAKQAESEAKQAEGEHSEPPPTMVALPAGLEGEYASPLLGRARVTKADDGLWFEAYEHGGLRCQLAAEAVAGPDGGAPASVDCKWSDPNMGVSRFALGTKGKRVRELRFRVRPSFYDPHEYAFSR